MTVIPPGFAQVVHEFSVTGDSEPMATTYAVSMVVPPVASLATIATALHNAASTLHAGIAIASCSLIRTTLRYMPPDVEDPLVSIHEGTTVGGNAGDALTQNTAWLFRKLTASGGRRNRGRFYWPGVRASSVDDAGVVASATVTGYNTSLANWLTAVKALADVIDVVILHSPAEGGGVIPPTIVTSVVCDSKVATQRRRLRR